MKASRYQRFFPELIFSAIRRIKELLHDCFLQHILDASFDNKIEEESTEL
jgi:hypothetical protein